MIKRPLSLSIIFCVIFASLARAAVPSTQPESREKTPRIVDRVSCSSLAQAKQPTDIALKRIAEAGFKYVDLAALSWCPHVSPSALVTDFDKESTRVESALTASHLHVTN